MFEEADDRMDRVLTIFTDGKITLKHAAKVQCKKLRALGIKINVVCIGCEEDQIIEIRKSIVSLPSLGHLHIISSSDISTSSQQDSQQDTLK